MAHAPRFAAPNAGLDMPGFDKTVRAQDDLFRAVNGGWLKTTEIPADKADTAPSSSCATCRTSACARSSTKAAKPEAGPAASTRRSARSTRPT
jgi:predicted metalloendopeptidase